MPAACFSANPAAAWAGEGHLDRQGPRHRQHLQQERQARTESGRALPAQHGNRIGADRGGQADLAAIRLAQT